MKKPYIPAVLEIILFDKTDIITFSGEEDVINYDGDGLSEEEFWDE